MVYKCLIGLGVECSMYLTALLRLLLLLRVVLSDIVYEFFGEYETAQLTSRRVAFLKGISNCP